MGNLSKILYRWASQYGLLLESQKKASLKNRKTSFKPPQKGGLLLYIF